MFKGLNRRIDALDVKRGYLSTGTDWDPNGNKALLDFYVKIMPRILNTERCNIYIHNPATGEIWLKAGTGLGENEVRLGKGSETVIEQVITTGDFRIINDPEEAAGAHQNIIQESGLAVRNLLCVPISSLSDNEVVGVVEVLNKADGASFSDEDRAFLEEMAYHLERAVENIALNLEATRLLRQISRVLTITASAILWIVGLSILAIIGRIAWVAFQHTIS